MSVHLCTQEKECLYTGNPVFAECIFTHVVPTYRSYGRTLEEKTLLSELVIRAS